MSLANVSQLALVGAGKMGGALLQGWLAHGLEPASVIIIDPTPAPEIVVLASRRGIKMLASSAGLGAPGVVVLGG
ncbi:MAG: NAD(P)-binding domain-containing protein, partial [Hyphomicrobiales bacterium]